MLSIIHHLVIRSFVYIHPQFRSYFKTQYRVDTVIVITIVMGGKRHGKNQTASSVYSYQERKKDQKQSGFGTLHERLGADSVKEFDCCCLTLQPCKDPVLTPQGYLFDREAVLEYILRQKKENAKRLKDWEKQKERDQAEKEEEVRQAKAKEVRKFAAHQATPAHVGSFDNEERELLSMAAASVGETSSAVSVSNMDGSRKRQLPSFWLPSQLKQARHRMLDKPEQKVYCPMSKKQLKLKELIPVKFTPMTGDESFRQNVLSKKVRYMCPITHDALNNTTPCALLKTSGHVVTIEAVEKIIRKDWIDPTVDKPISEEEIIPLARGGTGFASTNKQLEGKLARPVIELQ